jgi:transcriptional regulator with XRE-family HTH domain
MNPIHEVIKEIRIAKKIDREEIAKQLNINAMSYGKIERGEVSISLNKLYVIAKLFGMEAEDILTYGKQKQGNTNFNVTYVPVKVKAGSLTELFDDFSQNDCVQFNLPFFRERNLLMVDTEGDSMHPTVNDGDYTIIKQVEDKQSIKFGIPYLLDTTDGRVLKRIYQDKDPDKFILKSDNEIYEPYTINKDTILSLWETKGFMSKNLSPRNLYQKRLSSIENNLTELSVFFKSVGN